MAGCSQRLFLAPQIRNELYIFFYFPNCNVFLSVQFCMQLISLLHVIAIKLRLLQGLCLCLCCKSVPEICFDLFLLRHSILFFPAGKRRKVPTVIVDGNPSTPVSQLSCSSLPSQTSLISSPVFEHMEQWLWKQWPGQVVGLNDGRLTQTTPRWSAVLLFTAKMCFVLSHRRCIIIFYATSLCTSELIRGTRSPCMQMTTRQTWSS